MPEIAADVRRLMSGAVAWSPISADEDLLGFMLAEGQIIAAHLDFDRVAQRREADKLDRRPDQQTHFHQAGTAFGRKFYLGDGCSRAQCD